MCARRRTVREVSTSCWRFVLKILTGDACLTTIRGLLAARRSGPAAQAASLGRNGPSDGFPLACSRFAGYHLVRPIDDQ